MLANVLVGVVGVALALAVAPSSSLVWSSAEGELVVALAAGWVLKAVTDEQLIFIARAF